MGRWTKLGWRYKESSRIGWCTGLGLGIARRTEKRSNAFLEEEIANRIWGRRKEVRGLDRGRSSMGDWNVYAKKMNRKAVALHEGSVDIIKNILCILLAFSITFLPLPAIEGSRWANEAKGIHSTTTSGAEEPVCQLNASKPRYEHVEEFCPREFFLIELRHRIAKPTANGLLNLPTSNKATPSPFFNWFCLFFSFFLPPS